MEYILYMISSLSFLQHLFVVCINDAQVNGTTMIRHNGGERDDNDRMASWIVPFTVVVLLIVAILAAVLFCCCMNKSNRYIYHYIMSREDIERYTNQEQHILAPPTENE